MFLFTRRTSAATVKLLLCRLTENVACYSYIFLLEIRFVNFSPGLFQEYLFLYYAVHFLASFCQKFPHKMWIQWTDWATAVCSWSWYSRQRRPYRVRALVTIEIGAKIEVLDLVYPPSCLPSWSKPLSYRKLPSIFRFDTDTTVTLYTDKQLFNKTKCELFLEKIISDVAKEVRAPTGCSKPQFHLRLTDNIFSLW